MAGRPRGHKPLIDIVGSKRRVQLIENEIKLALQGDATARKHLLERMDPALARQELTGRDGAAIQVEKPDLSHWTTEELRALDAVATQHEERTAKANGSGNGSPTHH